MAITRRAPQVFKPKKRKKTVMEPTLKIALVKWRGTKETFFLHVKLLAMRSYVMVVLANITMEIEIDTACVALISSVTHIT